MSTTMHHQCYVRITEQTPMKETKLEPHFLIRIFYVNTTNCGSTKPQDAMRQLQLKAKPQ